MGKRIDKSMFKVVDLSLADVEGLLKGFEQKYRMDSKDFYRSYNCGKLEENPDYMNWATYYEMASRMGSRHVAIA